MFHPNRLARISHQQLSIVILPSADLAEPLSNPSFTPPDFKDTPGISYCDNLQPNKRK